MIRPRAPLRIAALLFLLALTGRVLAAPEALVDEFMQKSGLTRQLAGIQDGVLLGIEQAQAQSPGPQLSGEQEERLRAAVKGAFVADRLRRSMRAHLVTALQAADAEQALQWLDTPFGKRVTKIEEEGSTPEAFARAMETGAQTLAALSPARRVDIERLLKASGAVDVLASITLNQQLGITRGMALAAGTTDAEPPEDAKAKLEPLRNRIATALGPTLLATSAVLYASLSDAELRDYNAVLDLPSSRRVTKIIGEALDKALTAAAVEFGRRLGDVHKAGTAST